MFCTRCGQQNPDDADFCARCGTALLRPGGPVDGAADASSTSTLTGLGAAPETGETELPDDAEAVAGLPEGAALLVVRRGPNAGSRFLLDSPTTTAGRHPDSDIFLDDVTVSRRHAEFRRSDEGVVSVRDVGSLNGTYVNRERIDAVDLAGGDEVQIGKFRLVYLLAAGPAGAGAAVSPAEARRSDGEPEPAASAGWRGGPPPSPSSPSSSLPSSSLPSPSLPSPSLPSPSQSSRSPQSRSAPAPAAGGRAYMSIGEVLGQLRSEFPEVTISKIRFLETEGLVEPDRTPSGYRKFSRADVARLRYVLGAQRDRYLPLRVIKEQLSALDRGLEPATPAQGGPRVPRSLTAVEGPSADDFLPDPAPLRLSRAELLTASGLEETQLVSLEQYGLLRPRAGGHYDGDALAIAQTVGAMAAYNIEARHLRPFKTAADREVGLVAQVVSPLMGQRSPEARSRAEEVTRELAALSVRLHAALVRDGLHAAPAR